MTPMLAYVVAATAAFTPTLLGAAAQTDVGLTLIPAFVTDGQKAAMAALAGTVDGVAQADPTDLRALHRVNEVIAALVPLRGALIPGRTDLAQLTSDDLHTILGAVLDAVKAGCAVAGGYVLSTFDDSPTFQGQLFDALVAGQTDDNLADPVSLGAKMLTALGAQVQTAITQRDGVASSGVVGNLAAFVLSAQLAAKDLALEMDDVGYRIDGAPFEPTLSGGFAAAASAVGDFVTGIAGKTAGVALEGLASVLLSTPGLLLLGGILVMKAVRR